MSSIRRLKKDVNSITEELMIDAFTFNVLFPEKQSEALPKVIEDILAFRNNTIKAINSTKNESTEPVKNQFKNILTKMEAELTVIVEEMQDLHK